MSTSNLPLELAAAVDGLDRAFTLLDHLLEQCAPRRREEGATVDALRGAVLDTFHQEIEDVRRLAAALEHPAPGPYPDAERHASRLHPADIEWIKRQLGELDDEGA